MRDAIQQDTAVALDAILLDATASSTIRPPGLLNGVSGLTPTAGGGFTALVGDIKQLTNALLVGTAGNVRNPVWLMNPIQANSIGLIAAPSTGVFPFAAEINSGRLGGWPVIISGTVPATTVIVLDAADFVSVSEGPMFSVSDQATLHMEDTSSNRHFDVGHGRCVPGQKHVPDRLDGLAAYPADELDHAPHGLRGLGNRRHLVIVTRPGLRLAGLFFLQQEQPNMSEADTNTKPMPGKNWPRTRPRAKRRAKERAKIGFGNQADADARGMRPCRDGRLSCRARG